MRLIMKSTIEVIENDIVFAVPRGTNEMDEVMAWTMALKHAIKEQFDKGGPVLVLTDLNNVLIPNDQFVKELVIKMEEANASYVKKSAAFSTDINVTAMVDVLAELSSRSNFTVFKTKEEAIAWLRSD